MKTIALTHGKVANVDDADYDFLCRWHWCAQPNLGGRTWYAQGSRQHGRRRDSASGGKVRMHRIILGAPKGVWVHHKNRDGLDNRRANLCLSTPSYNSHLRVCPKRSNGLPQGVYPHAGRWMAVITEVHCWRYLGTFDTPKEAEAVYLAAKAQALSREKSKIDADTTPPHATA